MKVNKPPAAHFPPLFDIIPAPTANHAATEKLMSDETTTGRSPEKKPLHLKRNTVGGVIGNVLESHDFAVFGYFAPIIGSQFFPAEDQFAALINAFGVFAEALT